MNSEPTDESPRKKGMLARLLSSIQYLVEPKVGTEDRRSAPRLSCCYTVTFISENGRPGEAELSDVSSRGLRLKTQDPLSKGLTLALNAPSDEKIGQYPPLMARVVWSVRNSDGSYHHGLMVPTALADEESWLDKVLATMGYHDDGSQRRQHIRAQSEISGLLTLDDDPLQREIEVSIQNLGMGGALLRCPETLSANAQFSLVIGPYDDLPAVSLKGTILRVKEMPDSGFTLHPSRFRPLRNLDERVLKEYILKLIENE